MNEANRVQTEFSIAHLAPKNFTPESVNYTPCHQSEKPQIR